MTAFRDALKNAGIIPKEGDDQFDYMDSIANRYGYMVIAFQDIMTTIGKLTGTVKKAEDMSNRRAIAELSE